MIKDGESDRGSVNTVTRVGDVIHRPVHRWTSAVHELLRYLEQKGFAGVPRVMGFDDSGREVLSFLPGEVAMRPWPEVLLQEKGLVDVGGFLARYHATVGDFKPVDDAEWYVPGLKWCAGDVIRHGDLGPWNMVWQGDALVGIIDWDFAEPGHPLEDVAQFAWYGVPLRGDAYWKKVGFEAAPDYKLRLQILCDSYGAKPRDVLDALVRLQQEEVRRITTFGRQGIAPWDDFLERGDADDILEESEWLEMKFGELL